MALKIKISDGIEQAVSIWTEDDSSLTLESLNSVFFGATNLICPDDERGKVYLRIKDRRIFNPKGWDSNVVYVAHFGSRPTSPYLHTQGLQSSSFVADVVYPAPSDLTITDNLTESVYKRCRKYLYFSKLIGFENHGTFSIPLYAEGKDSKFMITVFTNEYAATSIHCLRKLVDESNVRDAEVEDIFTIYSCENPEMSFSVTIAKIVPTLDCAILKLTSGAFPHHPVIHTFETGMRAVCFGYPSFEDVKEGGILVEGQVHEKEPVPFPVEISALDTPRKSMFAASCGLAHGFSGGGLFRVFGKSDWLLGICTRGRVPPKEWLDKWAQENWLHRRSVSYYIYSSSILAFIDDMEQPATKKLKTHS